jgi:hypothetical protein
MWPWDKIRELEEKNENLSGRIDYLKSLELSDIDKTELNFLRKAIKPYVVYRYEHDYWSSVCKFYETRTLQDAESDLTKAKFYIAVLEAQLGPDGISAAKEVCERLKAVCNQKAIEAV